MERDVEMELTQRLSSLEATLLGFAKDTTRRLERIEDQTTKTNGRVDKLEQVNARRDGQDEIVLKPRPLSLADLRLYVAIAIGSGTMAVGVVLWVLKSAGALSE